MACNINSAGHHYNTQVFFGVKSMEKHGKTTDTTDEPIEISIFYNDEVW